jgi:hypothetical protein
MVVLKSKPDDISTAVQESTRRNPSCVLQYLEAILPRFSIHVRQHQLRFGEPRSRADTCVG